MSTPPGAPKRSIARAFGIGPENWYIVAGKQVVVDPVVEKEEITPILNLVVSLHQKRPK